MSDETIIYACGCRRTELPSNDGSEVRHHFLIAHDTTGVESVRYFYPERIEDEIAQWQRSLSLRSVLQGGDYQ